MYAGLFLVPSCSACRSLYADKRCVKQRIRRNQKIGKNKGAIYSLKFRLLIDTHAGDPTRGHGEYLCGFNSDFSGTCVFVIAYGLISLTEQDHPPPFI